MDVWGHRTWTQEVAWGVRSFPSVLCRVCVISGIPPSRRHQNCLFVWLVLFLPSFVFWPSFVSSVAAFLSPVNQSSFLLSVCSFVSSLCYSPFLFASECLSPLLCSYSMNRKIFFFRSVAVLLKMTFPGKSEDVPTRMLRLRFGAGGGGTCFLLLAVHALQKCFLVDLLHLASVTCLESEDRLFLRLESRIYLTEKILHFYYEHQPFNVP